MTATEVIHHIKIMPVEEREQVAAFLRQGEIRPAIRYADDQTVEDASKSILDRHAELMRKLAT